MLELGEVSIIFALSLLLAAGFAAARLAKLLHLPSVTGYILAGLALGPVGLGVIPEDILENRLQVFTRIALMLVAFGIGERFELQQLRSVRRTLSRVSLGECSLTFVLVATAVTTVAAVTRVGGADGEMRLWLSLGLVCASIAVTTAPAVTMVIFRELNAQGALSRLVLSSVVVNNGVSLTLFGIAAAIAGAWLGEGGAFGAMEVVQPLVAAVLSLALGLLVGWLTDLLVHRLHRRADVLVVSLTAVFFCGGFAEYLGLSSLLAGVAAGFAVVNRDRRDVRAFRALNDFEPPLYGVFFALAGAHLHLSELAAAGAIGVTFILARASGKYFGASIGAWSARRPRSQVTSIGLGFLPQGGLAIGLAYLVGQDDSLAAISATVMNTIVASVLVNELLGPPLVRWMVLRAAEAGEPDESRREGEDARGLAGFTLPAWNHQVLEPHPEPDGAVIAGLHNPDTAAAVTRLATLFSHAHKSMVLGLHVSRREAPDSLWPAEHDEETMSLFRVASEEARSLGYDLHTEVEFAEDVADAFLRAAHDHKAKAIILGHPLARYAQSFRQIVDAIADKAECPVVVARLIGELQIERILLPISQPEDLHPVLPVVMALTSVHEHEITVLRLLPPEAGAGRVDQGMSECSEWLQSHDVCGRVSCYAVPTESRVHEILNAAEGYDIIAMAAESRGGLGRAFFGSLAEDVAQRSSRPMLLVNSPRVPVDTSGR